MNSKSKYTKLALFLNIKFLFVLCFFCTNQIHGQSRIVEHGQLFTTDVVQAAYIYVHEDTLEWLYQNENLNSNHYFRSFVVIDNGVTRDSFEDVGFRLRGNTSRYAQKKSFKLSLNKFVSGRTYYGVDKLNFNGEHNDPSSMRAALCFDLYHRAGLVAARANHFRTYINDRFFGIYTNFEEYDEKFTASRFGREDGNLYKCNFSADLNYLGDDPDLYKLINNGERVYEQDNQADTDDYSDLAHFIDVLNNTPEEEFLCEIEMIFEVNEYLKYIAIDIVIGNWDGPLINKNNFFLYSNPATGKFEYLPYDLDNTFGIDWINSNMTERDIYNWSHESEWRPLYNVLMKNEVLKNRFSYYLDALVSNLYHNSSISNFVIPKRELINDWVEQDPFKHLDYGFTHADFRNSLFEGRGGHVVHGIIPFVDARRKSIQRQLDTHKIAPIVHRNSIVIDKQNFYLETVVESDCPTIEVVFCYKKSNASDEELNCLEMQVKGKPYNDFLDFSNHYEITLQDLAISEYDYFIRATDIDGSNGNYPSCGFRTFEINQEKNITLAINEFMASNGNTYSDEWNDFDDWIEVFNYGNDSIWVGDLYLSDKTNNPLKWKMPDAWIAPGEYKIIWADGETNQGIWHTNFSLSIDGEAVVIASNNNGIGIIDIIEFDKQVRDVSFGRYPDANGPFGVMEPSPGKTNNFITSSNSIRKHDLTDLTLFPNPVHDYVYLDLMPEKLEKIEVINIAGQTVNMLDTTTKGGNVRLDVSSLKSGVYFIKIGTLIYGRFVKI